MKKNYKAPKKNYSILTVWVFKCLLTVFAIIILCRTTHAQTWNTVGSVGFSAGTAEYTSIAIDRSGTPYVVYQDGGKVVVNIAALPTGFYFVKINGAEVRKFVKE